MASSNSVRNEPSGTNPIDIDTVIWLASTGKPILVIAALQLVEQGKLSLDDAEQVRSPKYLDIHKYKANSGIR